VPKELTHWHIADRVAATFGPDPANDRAGRIARAIETHRPAFLLGSVAYDSPFYALDFANRSLLAALADDLHGVRGEDTFERFRVNFADDAAQLTGTGGAFLAGALTHYAADVTVHPMVNHFCDGSPIASQRHRAFETCLDLYVVSKHGRAAGTESGMQRIVAMCDAADLVSAAAAFYFPRESVDHLDLARMFRRHAAIRDRFERTSWQLFTRLLGTLPGPLRVLAATFYPGRTTSRRISPAIARFFEQPIEYIHPHTGAEASVTTSELIDSVVERAVALIDAFCSSPPTDRGLSLDAGCDLSDYPEERFLWRPSGPCRETALGPFPWYCR